MAKTRKKKRKPTKPVAVLDRFMRPTPEREAKAPTRSAGMARRIIPVLDRLKKRLSQEEYETLHLYAQRAAMAETSPVRSCCDNSVRGGNGNGPGAAVISAKIDTALYENRMGPYAALARAVCVDDVTLTEWCITKYGGRERVNKGRVEIVPVGAGRTSEAFEQLQKAASLIRPG